MKVIIPLELTYDQTQRLINVAYSAGWSRDEPRKRWSEPEEKQAVRHAVTFLVNKATINKSEDTVDRP